MGFVSFLVGALLVGAAFGAYALGEHRGNQAGGAASPSPTTRVSGPTKVLDIHKILDLAQPSVVTIQAGGASSIFGSAGSGVVIEADGLIVTNAHVIEGAPVIEVRFSDGTVSKAELVGASKGQDLALIKVARTDLTPAKLGSSSNLRVGDDVVAIGNALNLGGDPSVTRGIVSAKDRSISAGNISLQHLIQTDAAINPGNSGGALVNADGEVVGINTAIIDGAQNVGFALSIDSVRALIPKLKAGDGDVKPVVADLGLDVVTVDARLSDATRRQYGVTASSGALVTAVADPSTAADAGIEEGDVITDLDGTRVGSEAGLDDVVHTYAPGDEVTVTVERQGRRRSFDVTLGG